MDRKWLWKNVSETNPLNKVLQQNLWVKKQFTPLILFKAQTDGLKIDEHRTSNVQHRMMNGKNEEANV